MEAIIHFLEEIPWYIWLFVIVVVPLGIGIGSWLTPVAAETSKTSSIPSASLPPVYTAKNVQPHRVYQILYACEDGHGHEQQFEVLKKDDDGVSFLIGVYYPGSPAERQDHFAFKGWAQKIPSNRRLCRQDLF